MWMHPDLYLDLAHDRRRELIAEAARTSLVTRALAARRGRAAAAPRGRPAGNLARCDPSAVEPAR